MPAGLARLPECGVSSISRRGCWLGLLISCAYSLKSFPAHRAQVQYVSSNGGSSQFVFGDLDSRWINGSLHCFVCITMTCLRTTYT